jgi:uncharacterized protein YcaQ
LHVARRDDGIKVYALAPQAGRPLTPRVRARRVLELLLRLYAPLPVATLRELMRMAADASVDAVARERLIASFVAGDTVDRARVDGIDYAWPRGESSEDEPGDVVRLIAPFDPFAWDRRRFAHLHGWEYRFEAYTPARKRRFGYYALPMLWRDRAVGWANVARTGEGLDVATGFVAGRPRERAFAVALDAEVERMRTFVGGYAVPAGAP